MTLATPRNALGLSRLELCFAAFVTVATVVGPGLGFEPITYPLSAGNTTAPASIARARQRQWHHVTHG